jgi:polysaccharide biosynthesis protein PslH
LTSGSSRAVFLLNHGAAGVLIGLKDNRPILMKILWVKAGGLVPPDIGGKIRSYSIVKELAKTHEVTLFNFYAAHSDDVHSGLKPMFHRVVNLPLPIATNRGLGELASFARNIFSSSPHTVSKYCRPEVKARMRELLASQKFDVIICDFVVAAAAIPWEVACPKVIFTHNVEALIWKRHLEVSQNPLWKMTSWGEYQKMIRFEKHFLNKSQYVLTVSEADKNFFSDFVDRSKMTVISTGVDTDYFRPDNGNEQPNSLVFTGSMDWMPNEDGVLYFLHSILPLIRREIPLVSFTIVGRKPSERLRSAAASEAGVQVTGTVDDIRPYVREGSVYVVPLRIGSGTRLKIFEAMAMGKAIVSTTLGAEGLPIRHGVDISMADSPEEFSRKVCGLLRDSEERRRLGSAARQMVEQHYSWSAVAAEFDEVLRRVAPLSSAHEMKLPAAEKVSALRA